MKNYGIAQVVKAVLSSLAVTGIARRMLSHFSEGLVTVFLLHRVGGENGVIRGHDPEYIESVLIELKRHKFNLIPLQQIVDAVQGKITLPYGSIAFTIDDGYRDQLEVLAPIFVKHEVPLTIFLGTGSINGELWSWDSKINWIMNQTRQTDFVIKFGLHSFTWSMTNQLERINARRELQAIGAALPSEKQDDFIRSLEVAVGVDIPKVPPQDFFPSNWELVRQLESSGVRFAPHTHTHRVLSKLSEADVQSELSRSLELVIAKTRHGLPVLAYPLGMEQHFGLREIRVAKRVGFSAAFAVCEDYARWRESRTNSNLRYRLGRFGLPHSKWEMLWLATGLQAVSEYCLNSSCTNDSKRQKSYPLKMGKKALLRRIIGRLYLFFGRFKTLKDINTERIERIVFVCRGNVCRSPYAEAAVKSFDLLATSCGVDVSRSVPAETIAVRAALLRGSDLTHHMSRSISDVTLNASDCLVTMDPSNLPVVVDIANKSGAQVTLLGLWKQKPVLEIADPYGKSLQEYNCCFDEIDEAIKGLCVRLNKLYS